MDQNQYRGQLEDELIFKKERLMRWPNKLAQ